MPKAFFTDEEGVVRPIWNGIRCHICGNFFVFRDRKSCYEKCPSCGATFQKRQEKSLKIEELAEVEGKPKGKPFGLEVPEGKHRKKRRRRILPDEEIDWSKKEDRYRYHNAYIKGEILRLRRMFGNQCQICGSQQQLEFAHLKPTGVNGRGRGRQTRLYDVKKNPDKYALLCRKCHLKFDRGEIQLGEKKATF